MTLTTIKEMIQKDDRIDDEAKKRLLRELEGLKPLSPNSISKLKEIQALLPSDNSAIAEIAQIIMTLKLKESVKELSQEQNGELSL